MKPYSKTAAMDTARDGAHISVWMLSEGRSNRNESTV